MAEKMEEFSVRVGGCHCGAVLFEARTPNRVYIRECNCSICAKSGYLHLTVAKENFRLIQGEDHLKTYQFNTGLAKHYFCKTCGIKSFYVPRSHPEDYSVNFRCLDESSTKDMDVYVGKYDGKNWEKNHYRHQPAPKQ